MPKRRCVACKKKVTICTEFVCSHCAATYCTKCRQAHNCDQRENTQEVVTFNESEKYKDRFDCWSNDE
jgi:hypothetical protein